MYNSPSEDTYKHFKMVNAHIKNGIVQVGQVVLLSPEGAEECTIEEAEFLNIAKAVDLTLLKLSNSEKQLLVNRYESLSNVASYNGLLLGVSNTAWNAHTNQVKSILKDLERAYVTSYQSSGNLHNKNFFAQRKIQFARLDAALSRFTQPAFGGKLVSGDIRGNLGLSSKSMIHQWSKQSANATTIPNFHKNYAAVAEMSRNLKRVGYVGIALTGFQLMMMPNAVNRNILKWVKLRVVLLVDLWQVPLPLGRHVQWCLVYLLEEQVSFGALLWQVQVVVMLAVNMEENMASLEGKFYMKLMVLCNAND